MPDMPAASENTAINSVLVSGTTYWLSLHTADPGTSGANEVTGGSYARKQITFGTASGGSAASSGTFASQSFTGMPAVAGNLWIGVWTAVTAGTFLWGGATAAVTGPIAANATVNFASGAVTAAIA